MTLSGCPSCCAEQHLAVEPPYGGAVVAVVVQKSGQFVERARTESPFLIDLRANEDE